MAVDVAPYFENASDLARRTQSKLASGLTGSVILDIAAEVGELKASGREIAGFTIGDFAPSEFRVPPELVARIQAHLDAGHTNYPPAVGTPELRAGVRALYERELGLKYPQGCVQVGSGARPPIFSAMASVLDPGDVLVYPVPSWNVRYYAYLNQAQGIAVPTRAEDGFMPTLADLEPYLQTARVIALNSPLNPSGTVITEAILRPMCEAIVAENNRRATAGERALILLYDQVYWQLVFGDNTHVTPVGLVPEMARYTVFIDAISKCWAATGLRVGWAVVPPWLLGRMKPLVGHMGAWAARPEQLATAELLQDPSLTRGYMSELHDNVRARLDRLYAGLMSMKADGLPVDALAPEGAIYLTAKVDLPGRPEEEVRRWLLHEAGVAVVPFSAFGYPEGSGWMRFSVGAVSLDDIDGALERIRGLLS